MRVTKGNSGLCGSVTCYSCDACRALLPSFVCWLWYESVNDFETDYAQLQRSRIFRIAKISHLPNCKDLTTSETMPTWFLARQDVTVFIISLNLTNVTSNILFIIMSRYRTIIQSFNFYVQISNNYLKFEVYLIRTDEEGWLSISLVQCRYDLKIKLRVLKRVWVYKSYLCPHIEQSLQVSILCNKNRTRSVT